jgi:hypothetical protein
MPKRDISLSDHDLFALCERFIRKEGATKIADELKRRGVEGITREQIYPLLAGGIDKEFIRLHPPRAMKAAADLKAKHELLDGREVYVLDVEKEGARDYLATEAAERVLDCVKILAHRRRDEAKNGSRQDVAVHIGLGAGGTTERFARHFAEVLRRESPDDLPKLVFHAMSSGFLPKLPMLAPVAFFSYFMPLRELDVRNKLEYVGMFCEPVARVSDYDDAKKHLGVRDAFEEAGKIDIVVTSLGTRDDEHGMFTNMFRVEPRVLGHLDKRGWIGDVQWRPYSATGAILEPKNMKRAVTLFEIEDFVRLANTAGKYVFLIAGPCYKCDKSKSKALLPLLAAKSLCAFNRLITDVPTAKGLLE